MLAWQTGKSLQESTTLRDWCGRALWVRSGGDIQRRGRTAVREHREGEFGEVTRKPGCGDLFFGLGRLSKVYRLFNGQWSFHHRPLA
jgi:hypothetical protein